MAGALTLAGELTIYTVGELRESWSAWLATLDPAEAARRPTVGPSPRWTAPGAQLLLALARSCAGAGSRSSSSPAAPPGRGLRGARPGRDAGRRTDGSPQ